MKRLHCSGIIDDIIQHIQVQLCLSVERSPRTEEQQLTSGI